MLFRWESGRQNGKYSKMLLFGIPKFMDCYLLHFPKDCKVPFHVDPAENGKKHYRLNIAILNAEGSKFFINGKPIFRLGERLIFFRPDKFLHGLSSAKEDRWWLSIGWVLPKRN